MSKQKPPRKTVESPVTSIQTGTKKMKNPPQNIVQPKPLMEREFYHSYSLQPFSAEENADLTDSENDFQLIDSDHDRKIINDNRKLDGEQKTIMNLWNEFIENHNQFGIKHMKNTCKMFIDQHIEHIRRRKLYNDLALHLHSLHHDNLLVQSDVWSVIQHLHTNMGIQQKYSMPVSDQNHNHQSIDKENPKHSKRKRASSISSDGLEPKQKQQRYHLRVVN